MSQHIAVELRGKILSKNYRYKCVIMQATKGALISA